MTRIPFVAEGGASGSSDQMARNTAGLLLATKLFVPRPRPDLVQRPRLLARLDEGLDEARCTLLSAPAGAGKTSLLAAWVAGLDRPVAWLALDEGDQEVHRVLRYLVASLQTIDPECGRTASALLDAPPAAGPEVVLTSLLNDLADLPAAALLILDDYHLVRASPVHAAIEFLLNHLPSTLHLVIATREDPPLPLPRLRASRQLSEVRAADLSFNIEEAAAFLDAGMGLRLTEQQVTALVTRTEGWAAGLQLAGLALRDRNDPAAFVAAFTGGHRLVVDYLMAEVLERQSDPVRRFLLVTSVLDRMCAPLCEALLAADIELPDAASPAISSQQLLEKLEGANLFLVPLDDERMWYRYHHLFADALRGRLAREAGPGAAAVLHRQASDWFGQQGLLPEAIGHALAAGAVDDAASWIEALMPSMFVTMSIHQALADWLSALPEPVVRSRPLLCLTHAWLLIHRVELEAAAAWVEAAEQALPAVDNEAARQARGAVAATRAYMATVRLAGVPKDVDVLAEQALADLSPDDSTFRGAAFLGLGQATLALGQLDRAEKAFTHAAMVSRTAGLVHGAVVAALQQVNVQRLRGASRRALATGWAILAWAGEHYELPSLGRLRTVMADLLLDGNDIAVALPLADEGLRAPREYGNPPPLVILASLPLIRLRLAEGDAAAAAAVLAELQPLVQDGPFAVLAPFVDAAEARVRLAVDEGAAALPWALALDPMALPDPLRWGVPGVEATVLTPLRVLVAQGRATADTGLLQEAGRRLDAAWQRAEQQGIGWLRLRLHIAQSLLAEACGDHDAALRTVSAAVAEAEPEGVIRPFLDEGAPMAALLAALRATDRHGPAVRTPSNYLDTLLAAFTGQNAQPPDTPAEMSPIATGFHPGVLAEPLSARELDVLRLLSDGRSNAEIGATRKRERIDTMTITLPAFTPLEDSLFLTLCARALDNRTEHPVLGDAMADEIVRKLDYDYESLNISTDLMLNATLRAKKLDEVTSRFLARHPDAIGLDLGAGLDTRAVRLDPPSTVDWYDVDFPAVATARERLIPERPHAHVVGADVRDSAWLDALPSDRPALIVADGLMGFLSRDEFVSLLNRLVSHFPSGEMVFNSYTPFTIWVAHHAPGTKTVADLVKFPGFKDPHEPESWNPKLKLVEEILLSRDLAKVPSKLRWYYRLQQHSKAWSRMGTVVLHLSF